MPTAQPSVYALNEPVRESNFCIDFDISAMIWCKIASNVIMHTQFQYTLQNTPWYLC